MTQIGERDLHIRRPWLPRTVGAVLLAPAATAELPQAPSKLAPKDAVHDEVDGRVRRHDDVAEMVVVVVRQAARVGDADHVDQLIDKRRSLTDEEDYDDNYHHLYTRQNITLENYL